MRGGSVIEGQRRDRNQGPFSVGVFMRLQRLVAMGSDGRMSQTTRKRSSDMSERGGDVGGVIGTRTKMLAQDWTRNIVI